MKVSILKKNDFEKMKDLFLDVFTNEPWFDKWNNEEQLHAKSRVIAKRLAKYILEYSKTI